MLENSLALVQPEDLVQYGLIPEFIGRLPVSVTLDELKEDALVRILTEPKNALIKQYKRLLHIDGVQLKFTPEALKAIARLSSGTKAVRAVCAQFWRTRCLISCTRFRVRKASGSDRERRGFGPKKASYSLSGGESERLAPTCRACGDSTAASS